MSIPPKPLWFLLLLPLLGACRSKQAVATPPPPTAVTVVTLKAESVTLTRELPGRTTPFLIAEIRPQITGIVQQRLFTEGGTVTAGQVLYQIDDATYRTAYNSSKAALARAQSAQKLARINAKRAADLSEASVISQQEYETVDATLSQAEADVNVAQAALASSEVLLGYTQITSPINGQIGISTVTQGALVTANQAAPLTTVQQTDPIYVDLTASSRELLEFRNDLAAGTLQSSANLPVTILLEDGTAYAHQGKIAFSDISVDPTTGSFTVRVVVPNPDGVLLPGMYVRAVVASGIRPDAILVPQQGVSHDPKGSATAMVVGQAGKVELRSVKATRTIGDKWLVDTGLVVGDRVIIAGLQKIRVGSPVNASEAAPSPVATAPSDVDQK